MSRAALARRFHDLVGEPPMAYLSQWRMTLTADLLRSGDATLDAIARQVGYANAFALSAAFKRLNGLSPSQYRQQFDGWPPRVWATPPVRPEEPGCPGVKAWPLWAPGATGYESGRSTRRN